MQIAPAARRAASSTGSARSPARVALVTGASRRDRRGDRATLARDGAQRRRPRRAPALAQELERGDGALGGEAIELDITAAEAPEQIAERFADGLDVVVHNAGVTRDRTLAKMPAERWSELMEINLSSRADQRRAARRGSLIGANGRDRLRLLDERDRRQRRADQLRHLQGRRDRHGAGARPAARRAAASTINAVAPGFIETQMTAAMPIAIREAGRRMNSLSQGGLPVDVAETIAWFASPASAGVNGNVVRVCGQSLLGA